MKFTFRPWGQGARVIVDGEAIAFISNRRRCPSCLGSGRLALPSTAPVFALAEARPCPACGGDGRAGYLLTSMDGDLIGRYPTLAAAEQAVKETWP